MMSGPAVDDAVVRARRLPSLRVGLHLVLSDGRPLLPAASVPDLVDADGRFRSSMARTGLDIVLRPGVRRQLAAEIAAQFAAFEATGLLLDHVNCHHHFHVHPTIAGQIFEIGSRYGLRAVRVPVEPADMVKRIDASGAPSGAWLAAPWIALLNARVRRRGLRAADRVLGLAWSGMMSEQRIAGALAQLPGGVTEMYVHPATSCGFAGAASGYRYTDELAALTAPGVIALVRMSGARLCGFSDLGAPCDT
jgi:hopanoid biosynthesis associated protein HpnK